MEGQADEDEDGKQALFKRLAQHLRFFAMDPSYILLVVSKCPRILTADMQVLVLSESLRRADLARRCPSHHDAFLRSNPNAPKARGPRGDVFWTFRVTFSAAEIAEASVVDRGVAKVGGLVAGFPWKVVLVRQRASSEDRERDKVYLYTGHRGFKDRSAGGDWHGLLFKYEMFVGTDKGAHRTAGPGAYGSAKWAADKIPGTEVGFWEAMFKENSPWLRAGGMLNVKVTIWVQNDQGPSVEGGDANRHRRSRSRSRSYPSDWGSGYESY